MASVNNPYLRIHKSKKASSSNSKRRTLDEYIPVVDFGQNRSTSFLKSSSSTTTTMKKTSHPPSNKQKNKQKTEFNNKLKTSNLRKFSPSSSLLSSSSTSQSPSPSSLTSKLSSNQQTAKTGTSKMAAVRKKDGKSKNDGKFAAGAKPSSLPKKKKSLKSELKKQLKDLKRARTLELERRHHQQQQQKHNEVKRNSDDAMLLQENKFGTNKEDMMKLNLSSEEKGDIHLTTAKNVSKHTADCSRDTVLNGNHTKIPTKSSDEGKNKYNYIQATNCGTISKDHIDIGNHSIGVDTVSAIPSHSFSLALEAQNTMEHVPHDINPHREATRVTNSKEIYIGQSQGTSPNTNDVVLSLDVTTQEVVPIHAISVQPNNNRMHPPNHLPRTKTPILGHKIPHIPLKNGQLPHGEASKPPTSPDDVTLNTKENIFPRNGEAAVVSPHLHPMQQPSMVEGDEMITGPRWGVPQAEDNAKVPTTETQGSEQHSDNVEERKIPIAPDFPTRAASSLPSFRPSSPPRMVLASPATSFRVASLGDNSTSSSVGGAIDEEDRKIFDNIMKQMDHNSSVAEDSDAIAAHGGTCSIKNNKECDDGDSLVELFGDGSMAGDSSSSLLANSLTGQKNVPDKPLPKEVEATVALQELSKNSSSVSLSVTSAGQPMFQNNIGPVVDGFAQAHSFIPTAPLFHFNTFQPNDAYLPPTHQNFNSSYFYPMEAASLPVGSGPMFIPTPFPVPAPFPTAHSTANLLPSQMQPQLNLAQPWPGQNMLVPPLPLPGPKRTSKRRRPKPMMIHQFPLCDPSPFAKTHQHIDNPIVAIKKAGESFGISLFFETKSVLVEPPPLVENNQDAKQLICAEKDSKIEPQRNEEVNTIASTQEVPSNPQTIVHLQTDPPKQTKQRRRRRRRIVFGVMVVTDPSKQNARHVKNKDRAMSKNLLQRGDIILAINGHSICGLLFQDACGLFTSTMPSSDEQGQENDESAIFRCELTIARSMRSEKEEQPKLPSKNAGDKTVTSQKEDNKTKDSATTIDPSAQLPPPPMPIPSIPLVVDEKSQRIVSGDFSDEEMKALIDGMKMTEFKCLALEGQFQAIQSDRRFRQALVRRTVGDLMKRWFVGAKKADLEMYRKAEMFWKNQWKAECDSTNQSADSDKSQTFLTDAQRSSLRALPRPVRGCRCGSLDHEYVHDHRCVLYRDFKYLCQDAEGEVPKDHPSIPNEKKGQAKPKGQHLMETVYTERRKKLQDQHEAEKAEAKFVQRMESLQTKERKMAVFAPGVLSVLILSAVAELQGGWGSCEKNELHSSLLLARSETFECGDSDQSDDDDEDNDSDDEDDVTLTALAASSSTIEPLPKRRKMSNDKEIPFHSLALAKIMAHISRTWGHVYKEPEHIDFAWRHQLRDLPFKTKFKTSENPREPDTLSFESLRFVLDDKELVDRLRQGPRDSSANLSDELLVAHLASSRKTGVYEELVALVDSRVLSKDGNGFVSLSPHWEARVCVSVLNDMWDRGWSIDADGENKFCLHTTVRNALSQNWKRSPHGWMMSSTPGHIIHSHEKYEDQKKLFEDEFEAYLNEIDGVGKFGI